MCFTADVVDTPGWFGSCSLRDCCGITQVISGPLSHDLQYIISETVSDHLLNNIEDDNRNFVIKNRFSYKAAYLF